jgi:hypothetical protein
MDKINLATISSCCIATVQAGLQLAAEGETLSCADCSAVIVYRHGRWTR